MSKNSIEDKYKAIEKLITHGSRYSEWQEAGLLRAIAKIIEDSQADLSSKGIKALLDEASKF